jgi:hypothetical protein
MSGIAGIFSLAKQYDTTTGVINNLTSKYGSSLFRTCREYISDDISWSIFLIGVIAESAAILRMFSKLWQVLVVYLW